MIIKKRMNRFRNFSKDQGGMEALQTVCIVAIAATLLIAAATLAGKGKGWMTDGFETLEAEIGLVKPAEAGAKPSGPTGGGGDTEPGSGTDPRADNFFGSMGLPMTDSNMGTPE